MIDFVVQGEGARAYLYATLAFTLVLLVGVIWVFRLRHIRPMEQRPLWTYAVLVFLLTVGIQGLAARWPGFRIELLFVAGLDLGVSVLTASILVVVLLIPEWFIMRRAGSLTAPTALTFSANPLVAVILLASVVDFALGSVLPWRQNGLDAPPALIAALHKHAVRAQQSGLVELHQALRTSELAQVWTLAPRSKPSWVFDSGEPNPWNATLRLYSQKRWLLTMNMFYACGQWQANSFDVNEPSSPLAASSVRWTPLDLLERQGGALPWNVWTDRPATITRVTPNTPSDAYDVQTSDGVTWRWQSTRMSQHFKRTTPNPLQLAESCPNAI